MADLRNERTKATFAVEELVNVLDGGIAKTQGRRRIRAIIEGDPVFSNESNIFLPRTARYTRAIAKATRLDEIAAQQKFSDEEFSVAYGCVSDDLPTLLQSLMFIPSIKSLCTDEQCSNWLPRAMRKEVLGCYAQTELGHGSNIRALQTTATYIPETDEFDIHTPTIEATKWWPGGLGRTANHAMVIARLILDGKDYGIHNFIVPIRSLENHKPLPGVTSGDIGPKIAFNSMDNGFLSFNHVRIPRTNMPMRFVQVTRDGKYVKMAKDSNRIAYITMMQVRGYIVLHSARELSKACTIAIRYAAVRRQGYDESGVKENQVLDYTIQQYRLMSLLACSYAFHFTGWGLIMAIRNLEERLVGGDSGGDVTKLMKEIHATSSGLKSLVTTIAADGIEDCRKSCGGHGYLQSSGLPEMLGNFLQQCTVEGDNFLLTQQTGSFLLQALQAALQGKSLGGECEYFSNASSVLSSPEESFLPPSGTLSDLHVLLQAFAVRSIRLIGKLGEKLQALMGEGKGKLESWNLVLIDVVGVSRAHGFYVIMKNFVNGVASLEREGVSTNIIAVLRELCSLFGLYWIQKEIGDFLQCNILTPAQADEIRDGVVRSLTVLRPNAVALVDAWDWSDFQLKSCLGRYDGDVYNALYKKALEEPLNHSEPVECYESTLKHLIKRSKL